MKKFIISLVAFAMLLAGCGSHKGDVPVEVKGSMSIDETKTNTGTEGSEPEQPTASDCYLMRKGNTTLTVLKSDAVTEYHSQASVYDSDGDIFFSTSSEKDSLECTSSEGYKVNLTIIPKMSETGLQALRANSFRASMEILAGMAGEMSSNTMSKESESSLNSLLTSLDTYFPDEYAETNYGLYGSEGAFTYVKTPCNVQFLAMNDESLTWLKDDTTIPTFYTPMMNYYMQLGNGDVVLISANADEADYPDLLSEKPSGTEDEVRAALTELVTSVNSVTEGLNEWVVNTFIPTVLVGDYSSDYNLLDLGDATFELGDVTFEIIDDETKCVKFPDGSSFYLYGEGSSITYNGYKCTWDETITYVGEEDPESDGSTLNDWGGIEDLSDYADTSEDTGSGEDTGNEGSSDSSTVEHFYTN